MSTFARITIETMLDIDDPKTEAKSRPELDAVIHTKITDLLKNGEFFVERFTYSPRGSSARLGIPTAFGRVPSPEYWEFELKAMPRTIPMLGSEKLRPG
jgi:hypothetical protein